jgi:hypothetical protein
MVLCFLAALACKSPGGSPQSASESITDARFGVEYVYGGETFFESIMLADRVMVRRYFNDDGRCRKMQRSPCYVDSDLSVARAELTPAEVAEFEALAKESGFMGSDPDPDGLKGKSLFYSYNLTVRLHGQTHTVRMGSFPGSTAVPPISRRIYLKLLDLAKRKGLST